MPARTNVLARLYFPVIKSYDNWPRHFGKLVGRALGNKIYFPSFALKGEVLKKIDQPFILDKVFVAGLQSQPTITMIHVKEAEMADYRVRALPKRSFELTIPRSDDPEQIVCQIKRGIAAIVARNRANLSFALRETRHETSNHLGVIGMNLAKLSDITAEKAYAEARQHAGRVEMPRSPSIAEWRSMAIDDLVNMVMRGFNDLKTEADDILAALDGHDPAGELEGAYHEVLRDTIQIEIPQLIDGLGKLISDLGALSTLKPISLAEICDIDNGPCRNIIVRQFDLFHHSIRGNKFIVRQIMKELVGNARRAAGVERNGETDLVWIDLSLNGAGDQISIAVSNRVLDERKRAYLLEHRDFLFEEAVDHDSHEKQRIFKVGITSRPQDEITADSGGLGLSLLWEYVVLRLGGQARADYNEADNIFSATITFDLVEPH